MTIAVRINSKRPLDMGGVEPVGLAVELQVGHELFVRENIVDMQHAHDVAHDTARALGLTGYQVSVVQHTVPVGPAPVVGPPVVKCSECKDTGTVGMGFGVKGIRPCECAAGSSS